MQHIRTGTTNQCIKTTTAVYDICATLSCIGGRNIRTGTNCRYLAKVAKYNIVTAITIKCIVGGTTKYKVVTRIAVNDIDATNCWA